MTIVLLGPQRSPTVDAALQSLDLVDGDIATITAGWQEREPDDDELDDLLDGRSVNLGLHARWLDVLDRDPDFAAADRRLRVLLDDVAQLYRIRLDHAMGAVYDVQRHVGVAQQRLQAAGEAIDAVRALDEQNLVRIGEIHDEFYASWPPHEREVVAGHRARVAEILDGVACLVVAGGHVGVLLNAMHRLNVAAALACPVIAWSAGAMALTERVVLFNDRAVSGAGHAEMHGRGLSLLHGVVALPHAASRLCLDDPARMAAFAQRFAPARCLLLERGSEVVLDDDDGLPPGARVIAADGAVAVLAAAA